MEVDKPNAIKEIIQKNVQINNNKVTIEAEREEIPEIVNKLVENKIKLYSITENTLSLEDAFIKKTGGNVIE